MILKKVFSSEFGKGAIILIITMGIYNFLNFVFHFAMGRMLGPSDYGIFSWLMALIYVYSIPAEAIQNLISKHTAKLNIKKENGKINFLMNKSLRKLFSAAVFVFIISIFVAWVLSSFIPRISFWLILITNIFIFSSFSVPVVRGILQGRKKFLILGNNMILESGLKLFFAISFVFFGFKVFGAMVGIMMGVFTALFFAYYSNNNIRKEKEKKVAFPNIKRESIPYFVSIITILVAFNLDIFLSPIFFSKETAGLYAAISMIGKIIYFGTLAVSKAMFPLTSEKENIEESKKIFKKAFLVVSGLCLIGILFYLLIPKFIIQVFYGKEYIGIAPYLVYSGIALSFLSLTNLVLIYALSIDKLRFYGGLLGLLAIEVTLLFSFHNSLQEYILAFMFSNILIFICSFFFIKSKDEKN